VQVDLPTVPRGNDFSDGILNPSTPGWQHGCTKQQRASADDDKQADTAPSSRVGLVRLKFHAHPVL
jgi:hypothetical protein